MAEPVLVQLMAQLEEAHETAENAETKYHLNEALQFVIVAQQK